MASSTSRDGLARAARAEGTGRARLLELTGIGGVCSVLLVVLACAGPEPAPTAVNPLRQATSDAIPGGEALPLDGLWKVEGGDVKVQLERGRMYIHSGFALGDPDEWTGAILLAEVQQTDATHYQCAAPSISPAGALDWRTCILTGRSAGTVTVLVLRL